MTNNEKTMSILISTIILIIYLFYNLNIINTIPCNQDISSKILANFIHIDFMHLISNLSGLYLLSKLEYQVGSKNFLKIFFLITIVLSLLEYSLKTKCSIGISGVIYGLVAYEMFKFKNIDLNIISTLVILFLFSGKSKISHTGHLLGFISGLSVTVLI